MCKAIVIANEHNSTRRMLEKPLASAGVEVVAWVSFKDLHQADPGVAELVIYNQAGLPGKRNDVSARVRAWGLPLVAVTAYRKGSPDMAELFRWQGARQERKAPKSEPKSEASSTPHDPKGPPCVVCGKPVRRKVSGRNGAGWAKTCGSIACLREARTRGARKATATFCRNRKAEKSTISAEPTTPIQPTASTIEPSEVNHRSEAIELVKVPFDGGHIDAVQNERGIWAGIRRMCEDIGVDVEGQRKKLKDAHWARTDIISARDSLGRIQQIDMLNAADIAKWLSEINPNKVAPHIKAKLEVYQVKARDVLASHFTPRAAEAAGIDTEAVLMAALQHARDIKSLKAKQEELARSVEELQESATRPAQVIDEDALADKAAEKATSKLAATWTTRPSPQRLPKDPGPTLPMMPEKEIGSSSSILCKMRSVAERIIQEMRTDAPRDYVTNRLNNHMRIVATVTYKRKDLTRGSLGTLPEPSLPHLLDALDSFEVINPTKRDIRSMATVKGWLVK